MKAIFLVAVTVITLLCFSWVAQADWKSDVEILKAEFKPCMLYSITENQLTYATSVQLLGFRGLELNGIYSSDKNMPAIGVGYEIASLEKLGVDVPLAKYINLTVGGYVGSRDFTTDSRSSDWGVFGTIIKATF